MKKLLFIMLSLFLTTLAFAPVNLPSTSSATPTPPPVPTYPIGSFCDLGNVPAATLLVPYFEVDSSNPLGLDTLVAIINLKADYIVAHVNVWNVDSWVVFDFNIALTPFDVVTFSMRDILVNGRLPNNGCVSDSQKFRVKYVDCNGDGNYFAQPNPGGMFVNPNGAPTDIACYGTISGLLSYIQCMLSEASYDGWSSNYIGYITIDDSITCSRANPNFFAYFQTDLLDTDNNGVGDHSIIENSNDLLGDIIFYDYANNQSDGMPAVHIEAFGERNSLGGHMWGMQAGPGNDFDFYGINTFYNKFIWAAFSPCPPAGVPGNSAGRSEDAREPLPLYWAFRYIGNAAFDGGTWIDVWRSHHPIFDGWYIPGGPCPYGALGNIYTVLYDCVDGNLGLHPVPVICYDEQEETTSIGGEPSHPGGGGANILILETQRTKVEVPDFPLPAQSGWCGLTFDTDTMFDVGMGYGVSYDQAWVNVRYSALNKYTVGLSGVSYLNGCQMIWADPDATPGSGDEGFVPVATH